MVNVYTSNGTLKLGSLAELAAPRVLVKRETTLSNDGYTTVTFTSATFDNAAHWSAGDPQKIFCKEAGVYSISATIEFPSNATGHRLITIEKNGVEGAGVVNHLRKRMQAVNGQTSICHVAGDLDLAVGDYIALSGGQGAGGALDMNNAHLMMVRTGRAVGNVGGDPWVTVPSFQGTWVADLTPRYYKDPSGIVRLNGRVRSGTIGTTAFTLPVGYRPDDLCIFPAACNNSTNTIFGELRVDAAGNVIPNTGSSANWFSLDGCSFRAV